MKITKKAFIESITENETIFAGVTKKLYTSEETYRAISVMLKLDNLETRTCKARSRDLVFSNGSHLYFSGNGKDEFHKYTYPECTMFVYCDVHYDEFDEKDIYTCMYYMIKN